MPYFSERSDRGRSMATSSSNAKAKEDEEGESVAERMSRLPIRLLKDTVVSKIKMNRVTLLVADTGSGKSSQIPQMLLEEGMDRILCTQPRRLAVVSISQMVAAQLGCQVGDEVGYQIGQLKVLSSRSKIIFKTAGVLLEELRGEGLDALSPYKVLILDEVHERSIESDLVLGCVKLFMLRKRDIRLVLMSATADINRYKDYFKDLGRSERVEVIAIPDSVSRQIIFQCRERYLEDVFKLLERKSCTRNYAESEQSFHVPRIGEDLYMLILELVRHINDTDNDTSKSVLVFLPTYVSLEHQWVLLKSSGMPIKVDILHSSIDVKQAVASMHSNSACRKIILATSIAESSLTIPGVSYVIDACRSLDIVWDEYSKKDSPQVVWVSKSQANQRKGRTGRTCDGEVFRLVSQSFYNSFDIYEKPAMLRLSLRRQVLMMSCSESKIINDAKSFFQRLLDPPPIQTIQGALDMLISINALVVSVRRGKYEPTPYGQLLGTLPLSLEASMLVVKFGLHGLLREGILIGSLMDMSPMPIMQPFGQKILFGRYLESYYKDINGKTLDQEKVLIANLNAVQFWQRSFKDKHRVRWLQHVASKENVGEQDFSSSIPKLEEEWSSFHHLVQSSLHSVAETYEVVIGKMHYFRPTFLHMLNGPPLYYNDYEFRHLCLLSQTDSIDNMNHLFDLGMEDNQLSICCIKLPYVDECSFNYGQVVKILAAVMKEIRSECRQHNSALDGGFDEIIASLPDVPVCNFFLRGVCNRGSSCLFRHINAEPEPCRNFLTPEGCRYGNSCWFSHGTEEQALPQTNNIVKFEDEESSKQSLISLLPNGQNDSVILLFEEQEFSFALKLCSNFDPSKVVVCTATSELGQERLSGDSMRKRIELLSLGVTVLPGINPSQFLKPSCIPWKKVKRILWNVLTCKKEEDIWVRNLMKIFLQFLAARLIREDLSDVEVILTMYNKKYGQLQVERMARENFFFLSKSILFDNHTYGIYPLRDKTQALAKPVSYVFVFQPPAELSDYSSKFCK